MEMKLRETEPECSPVSTPECARWGIPLGWLVQRAFVLLVVIGLPILLIQLAFWLWQPMFHNELVMGDPIPFLFWARQGPYCDDRENAATADYRHNLLVVFLTANSNVTFDRFWYPRSRDDGVVFPALHQEDETDFLVPRSTDTLFVFGADGSRRDFPLATGEAERIFALMKPQPQPPDLVHVLLEAYAKRHSPDSSATLKEAIATLCRKGTNQSR